VTMTVLPAKRPVVVASCHEPSLPCVLPGNAEGDAVHRMTPAAHAATSWVRKGRVPAPMVGATFQQTTRR
jgi:hypothetical protein